MVRLYLSFVFLFWGNVVAAQQFGGFAPRTRWQQIHTDTARIIFEAPSAAQAQRIAALIHRIAATKPAPLGNEISRINIVLHANTTLANGYVGLAPFRSEFYLIPSSDIFAQGTVPFHEQLAIHEYRHVQQYNNMNRGLAKVFRAVLGGEGQALANALAIPDWFFEGDAVWAETALTPQGRGRLPYFTNGPASIWEAGRKYSLMKWMNGSLKDYVPNHYQFGYLLTNYGYKRYGAAFWTEVIAAASAFKRVPTPFRSAVKKSTGLPFRQFVQQAFADYQKALEPGNRAIPEATVTNQYFAQKIGADSLLYLEASYRKLPHFMLQTKENIRVLELRRLATEDWFSFRKGQIAYAAYATHPRWNLTDYSNIVVLDMATGRERTLTKKAKYFTPDISPSGKKIVAVHTDSSTRTQLHILNVETGAVAQRIAIAEGTSFFHPRFIDDENLVVVHRRRNGSVALHRWNLQAGTNELLVYGGFNVMGYPFVANGQVYFSSSASGSDDVYAYDLKTTAVKKLTASRTGNYFVSATADSIYFSNFTANGLRLQSIPMQGMPVTKEALAGKQERFAVAADSINLLQTEARRFATSRYDKSTRLVNLHSWRPYYQDPEWSFTAYSNNILNTLNALFFYRYNEAERSHGLGTGLAYGGFFPVLTGSAEYTFNRHLRTPQGTRLFSQVETSLGYHIPLNFTKGKTFKFLRFGSSIVFNRLAPQGKENMGDVQNRTYLYHFATVSQYLPMARQHLFPKWGYSLSPAYRHQLAGPGYQRLLNGQVFLPSAANHSMVLQGAAQYTDTALGLFTNRFANARGYADYYLPRMWRLSANYHFPIVYPDWGFGGLLYLLRIRANVYYDHSAVWKPDVINKRTLRSTGAELFFDVKLMNQLQTSVGLRHIYLLDRGFGNGNRHVFAVVLPVNFIPGQ